MMTFSLAQIEEMLSPDNFWYASQALDRQATPMEAVLHWIKNRPIPPQIIEFEVDGDNPLFT